MTAQPSGPLAGDPVPAGDPVSPGGIGTEQAFLVYTLRGQAPKSALLAFSVGMRLTLTTVNVVLGFAAILITFRTLRFKRIPDPAGESSSA